MHEVGTFDDDTRPTATQVEEQIDASMALVGIELPPFDKIPAELVPAVAAVVSLDAACTIEKSYWPEQVQSERSQYAELKVERDQALAALAATAGAAAGGGDEYRMGQGSGVIGSWTMIGYDDCCGGAA